MEANSKPMAPPPMIAARSGSSVMDSSSSLVMIRSPSTSKPGSVRGTDPVARTTWSAVSVASPDSPPETVTDRSGPRVPQPSSTVTLRPSSSLPTPLWS